MSEMTVLEIIYGLAMLGLGALVAVLRDAIKDLFRRHHELADKMTNESSAIHARISQVRENLAGNYVQRADLADALRTVNESLVRIETALNSKEDKR